MGTGVQVTFKFWTRSKEQKLQYIHDFDFAIGNHEFHDLIKVICIASEMNNYI